MTALSEPGLRGTAGRISPWRERAAMAASRYRGGPMALFWLLVVGILVLPIALFLLVAFSPRLLGQPGPWFTVSGFDRALRGPFLHSVLDTLLVGVVTAVVATAIGIGVSWAVLRTTVPGRRLWSGSMFALLLAPSYLVALGWQRLVEPAGVLDVLGIHPAGFRHLFYGAFGVIVILSAKGLPFAYLAVSSALRGLGDELEAAVRVHGGGRAAAFRVLVALVAPAVWSSLAIVFAESISDFGVADTLASAAHFPIATFTLYNAVGNFPIDFPVAAAIGWLLLAMAGVALVAQNRAMRGRSYRVLGGRTRPARRHGMSRPATAAVLAGLASLVVVGLGIPALGAVSASLINGLGSLASSHGVTLANYTRVWHSAALRGPLLFSARLAAITATVTVVLGSVSARTLAERGSRISARTLDLLLLGAVALPGIVFAAGYIFTYNLPLLTRHGIKLYETSTLLVLAYVATALPAAARLLLGPFGQVQHSLREAGRVHGAGPAASWLRTLLPVLARPLINTWVLTYCATLLELPVSQLLYPPNHAPVSVGITKALANYDFGGGTAMEVLAILFALAVVAAAWGAFRLAAPAGWRRLGVAR